MNILFILPEYYPHSGGGISTYYLHHLRAFKTHCEKIKVIIGSGYTQSDDAFVINGIEIEYLKPSIYLKYLDKFSKFDLLPEFKNNIAAAWGMYEQTNHGDGFDIIECTDFGFGFVPWVINHRKPVITRLHGSTGQITIHEQELNDGLQNDVVRQTELLLLPLCDTLITHSTANKTYWEALLSKPVVKILPYFTTPNTDPMAFAERDQSALVTARVQVWKGPVELCRAISAKNITLSVKWYGRDMSYLNRPSTSAYLKETFPEVWEKTVLPQNPVGIDVVKQLQKNAKFGIIPSTWDMFNFTCVEFMAVGTPVVCSDGAGSAELIEHKVNGFKYKADDIEALANCLNEMNRLDERTYNRMAAAGIETVKNELSTENLIDQNLYQYDRLAASFELKKRNEFLDHIYLPSEKKHTIAKTLDKQPIRLLLNYIFKRLKSKYISK